LDHFSGGGSGEIDVDGTFDGVQRQADEMQQSHSKQVVPVRDVERTFPSGGNSGRRPMVRCREL